MPTFYLVWINSGMETVLPIRDKTSFICLGVIGLIN